MLIFQSGRRIDSTTLRLVQVSPLFALHHSSYGIVCMRLLRMSHELPLALLLVYQPLNW